MLYEFIATYHDVIISRAREKVSHRPWPAASAQELENGLPTFLDQLVETLRMETTETPLSADAMNASATLHGRDLMALGFSVSQVVHDYGEICQAVTELAVELDAPITTEEFHTLNRCLDTAIAEAVTEHARITAQDRSSESVERMGQLSHELRDKLNTALFAFYALKRGSVAINGSTGAVLGRSLMDLRDLVDTTLAGIRIAAGTQQSERITLAPFLNDLAVAAGLHAEDRGLQFGVDPVDPKLCIDVDSRMLSSAIMNLLNNAFKFTRPGSRVTLRAHQEDRRVRIEVEDECGGIPAASRDPFQPFAEQRGNDRSGLGLGLSIARKAVRAQGGDITIRNLPGKGCVFVIEIPVVVCQQAKDAASAVTS
jgi:signal transduction histidine kinase